MEDDQIGRRPKWKTTKMEAYCNLVLHNSTEHFLSLAKLSPSLSSHLNTKITQFLPSSALASIQSLLNVVNQMSTLSPQSLLNVVIKMSTLSLQATGCSKIKSYNFSPFGPGGFACALFSLSFWPRWRCNAYFSPSFENLDENLFPPIFWHKI